MVRLFCLQDERSSAGEIEMAHKNQPDRWEATWLAAAMAVAGAPYLFDKLSALMRVSLLSFPSFLHSTPVLLVGVGAILLLAEQGAISAKPDGTEGGGNRHEL
jgi:hypothetical protein